MDSVQAGKHAAALLQVLEADVVLWTAGSRPVTRAGEANGRPPALPFPANERGALRTDPTLRVLDHPRVFALGDVAGPAAAAVVAEASTSGQAASFPATAQARALSAAAAPAYTFAC
jgi:NADH dehydrogenase FAD-containing subunit